MNSEPTTSRVREERRAEAGAPVVLAARGVRKSFTLGRRSLLARVRRGLRSHQGQALEPERTIDVLHGVDLELREGELLALVGSSGAGKSTLLHCLGLLDRPSAGEVLFRGVSGWELPLQERARLRNQEIGFVFQFYHLLPELVALENVLLPAMVSLSRLAFRARRAELLERARSLLERFGLADRMHHRPAQLSGGERQRVAMARALFLDPAVLLADEPTGNLDSATGASVLELLLEEQRRRKLSMILVTHDEKIARRCDRTLHMKDGRFLVPPPS